MYTFIKRRAHPELNQGPADLQSAALTTELYTRVLHMLLPSQLKIEDQHDGNEKGPAEI